MAGHRLTQSIASPRTLLCSNCSCKSLACLAWNAEAPILAGALGLQDLSGPLVQLAVE